MIGKSIIPLVLLLLVSAHMMECAVVAGLLDNLDLPQAATTFHNKGSSASIAASSTFSEMKNYFENLRTGVSKTFNDHFHRPHHGGHGPVVSPKHRRHSRHHDIGIHHHLAPVHNFLKLGSTSNSTAE